MALMRGLDVSRFQGVVNWNAVPAEREFVIVGAFDWRAGEVDNQLTRNVNEASRQGRVVGGYVRANPPRYAPHVEVRRLAGILGAYGLLSPGRLWPVIDVEPTGVQADDVRVDWSAWTRSFFDAWDTLTGLPLLVYSSGSYFTSLLGGTTTWPDWVKVWVGHSERYSRPKGLTAEQWAGGTWYEPSRAVIHQYTTTGTVSGITGAVDLDCLMPTVSLRDVVLRAVA